MIDFNKIFSVIDRFALKTPKNNSRCSPKSTPNPPYSTPWHTPYPTYFFE